MIGTEIRDKYAVMMIFNKSYRAYNKHEVVWVVPNEFDNKGNIIFGENTRCGARIPEKYLDVITRLKNPEYYL